ncbi:glutathione S-transferase N-terminal domain-containing protein [Methylomarinum sp. Ch1-1]|uniref:Glutathione S-transferase N-terminal domain-containing protein n=1 Tax=Methylomarinum roseum TaxID=3067653 RepID=A0AAU7NXZ1_9GAMM|nr:glutathione S-transferase N-terminal domain-containing protein [Methylomarinum sp. Ch1-1]MDP4521973.1 glutathione S-transferase N-terminal domain-containing protein [Methylomarinum sp. Ch1-1]
MTLFTSPTCAMSHCARLVLREKGVTADIEYFDPNEPPEDLLELNPNGTSPTLIERDLVLYDSRIIMEYLDERFPHPPLHQMDPVSRASARMLIKRIDQDWYQLLDEILNSGEKKSARAKKMLRESLLAAAPVFESHPYFMSDEYSLIDCAMAPLLWRLPSLGIDIASLGKGITAYANRLFSRKAFQESLSPQEKEMAAQNK